MTLAAIWAWRSWSGGHTGCGYGNNDTTGAVTVLRKIVAGLELSAVTQPLEVLAPVGKRELERA